MHKGNNCLYAAWAISVFYGLMVIPIDFVISLRSDSIGFVSAFLLSLRSCGLVAFGITLFAVPVCSLLKLVDRIRPNQIERSLRQAILMGSGIFAMLFFLLFTKFFNKFQALIAAEVFGGVAALAVVVIMYRLLQSRDRSQRLADIGPKFPVIGTLIIIISFGISFIASDRTITSGTSGHGPGKSDLPNIMLIVLDTVRADHMSLYGYSQKTTPFLEKMAKESAVFNNAFAASSWTLPSHASIFTGLYPSQHNTHGEHFWLDDSYRTVAEMLNDNGYQTISFSNNDYITDHHNLVQGFERTWYKEKWTDIITLPPYSFGGAVISLFGWLSEYVEINILAKVIKNPASIWDYPNAAVTNKAVSEWLENERDKSRPFFVFINYMDAHFPYNPDDETARLFVDEEDLKESYSLKLRFPPLKYMIDISKGNYTEKDLHIMSGLYDSCIRSLDNELEKLMSTLSDLGMYDDTLIIITSDHGEYLGTRNRLAHGIGLHEEVIHVPLMARYPDLFEAGVYHDTAVTHIDISETILSAAKIKERPNGQPEALLLHDLNGGSRSFVFGEFRFPLNLLVGASLLEDQSGLFVEQKTIRNRSHQFIWKSRGMPEFYDVINDPSAITDTYSDGSEKAETMNRELSEWAKSLSLPEAASGTVGKSREENREIIKKLRAVGYIN